MSDWKQYYEDLRAFIDNNPVIELSPTVISIPPDVREQFYILFDRVRSSIIREDHPQMIERGQLLSREYNATMQNAVQKLNLENIEQDLSTNWFLKNPTDGLMRLLFDPLFDVLRGKKDFKAFEGAIPKIMQQGFTKFMHDGYHSWIILSLLELMDTDQVYTTKQSELDQDPSLHVEMAVDGNEENVPDANEAKVISFKPTLKFSFLVPNVIAHSQKSDSFVSFVPDFEFSEAKWRARNLDLRRRWLGLTGIFRKFGKADLWPDIAVYVGDDWKSLVVGADKERVGQPEVILELRPEKGWYEREGLALIRRHYEVMEPKFGSFVISLDEVPEAALLELVPVMDAEDGNQPGTGAVSEVKRDSETHAVTEEPAATGLAAADAVPTAEVSNGANPSTGDEGVAAKIIPEPPPPPNIHLLGVGFDVSKLGPIVEAILGTATTE